MRFVFHQVDHLCAIAALTWGSCECSNIRGHAENAVHLLAMQNMLMISEEYSAGHRLSPFADCTRGCLGMNWIVTVACSDESDPSRMQKQPHGKIGRQFPMQPWSVGRSEGKNRKTIRIVLKHLFKGHKKGGQGGKERGSSDLGSRPGPRDVCGRAETARGNDSRSTKARSTQATSI